MKTFLKPSIIIFITAAASHAHASDIIVNQKDKFNPSFVEVTHEHIVSEKVVTLNLSDFQSQEKTVPEGNYKKTPKPQLNYDLVDGFDLKLGILNKKKPLLNQRLRKHLRPHRNRLAYDGRSSLGAGISKKF